MARFGYSKGRESRGRDDRSPRRESRSGGSFEEYSQGKRESRGGREFGRERRPLEMTRVICSACKSECEVPFKPNSNKPVYCRDCFSKKDNRDASGTDSSRGRSSSDSSSALDIINKKLDKIMNALKID